MVEESGLDMKSGSVLELQGSGSNTMISQDGVGANDDIGENLVDADSSLEEGEVLKGYNGNSVMENVEDQVDLLEEEDVASNENNLQIPSTTKIGTTNHKIKEASTGVGNPSKKNGMVALPKPPDQT